MVTDLPARLQQMLHEAGPRGLTSDALGDELQGSAGSILGHMRKKGLAWAHKPGKNMACRFFETEAWRDAYVMARTNERKGPTFGRKKIPGGATVTFRRDAVTVWPAHVKVQHCAHGGGALKTGTHASEE